ncbi:unnamed protein product [Albugo candida]|uniref:DM2 domain-containing protein n=1 Tax=Albugo candida TaxID=65357 RepID=A0A024GL02_9STRA|nr:unnamed protein product [Albugo candida]|eukprot:CCI47220.1 unnamed protein product [Albugo candida]
MTSLLEALQYSCSLDPNAKRSLFLQEKVHLLRQMDDLQRDIDHKIRQYASNFSDISTESTQVLIRRVIRLRVSHIFPHNDQIAEEIDAQNEQWRLEIQLEDSKHLATYFRKIIVKCDASDTNIFAVEWTNYQKSSQEMEKLEITRSGLIPNAIVIQLVPTHISERYALSRELKEIIGEHLQRNSENDTNVDAFTKKEILVAFWEYVFHRNLMKEENPSILECDEKLKVIFNACKSVPYASITIALERHLFLQESIDIVYKVKDSSSQSFELKVFVPNEICKRKREIRSEWEQLRQKQEIRLMQLEKHRFNTEKQLLEVLQRQQWMRHFALNPVEFMRKVEHSQKADKEVLINGRQSSNTASQDAQFHQPWAADIISDIQAIPEASLLNGSKGSI